MKMLIFNSFFVVVKTTERRKNQSFTLLFIYFITENKYRFCISVIGYINVQIIGIGYKKINIGRSLVSLTCSLSILHIMKDPWTRQKPAANCGLGNSVPTWCLLWRLPRCVRLETALLDRSDVSLCFLSQYFDLIRSSRMSRDRVIAAYAVVKSRFFISRYYRKCN